MVAVTLSRAEAALVRHVLRAHLADLRQQLAHTDTSSMRERLHLERDLTSDVLAKLDERVSDGDLPW